jgi:hypothetical protein
LALERVGLTDAKRQELNSPNENPTVPVLNVQQSEAPISQALPLGIQRTPHADTDDGTDKVPKKAAQIRGLKPKKATVSGKPNTISKISSFDN